MHQVKQKKGINKKDTDNKMAERLNYLIKNREFSIIFL